MGDMMDMIVASSRFVKPNESIGAKFLGESGHKLATPPYRATKRAWYPLNPLPQDLGKNWSYHTGGASTAMRHDCFMELNTRVWSTSL